MTRRLAGPFPLGFWLLCFGLGVSSSACGGCGSCMSTETHADVPTKLADVRKLAHPPAVVVNVERKVDTAGGSGGCGHSPICLLVLPISIYGAIFPHKWDEASVLANGKLSYRASFETNGEFIESTKWEPTRARFFGALVLKKLGKRLIVQIGEAPLVADGGFGAMRRVPVLPQVDLIAEYESKLAKEHDASDRGELIVEAATWLGDESVPFVDKHEKDTKEPDETRALVLEKLCEGKDKLADTVFGAAHDGAGPETLLAGLRCANRASRADQRVSFGVPAAELLCKSAEPTKELEGLAAELPHGEPLRAVAEHCANLPMKTLLRRSSGAKLTGAELVAAMRDPSPMVGVLAKRLVLSEPDDRAALFAGIEAHPELDALVELIPSGSPVSAQELASLAKAFAQPGRGDDLARRLRLLHLFDEAFRGGVDTARARAELELAIAREPEPKRARDRLGLLVLGDRQQAAAAALGLGPSSADAVARGVEHEDGLFGVGFSLAGCTRDEIRSAAADARKHKDSDRGALCAK